jgi:histidinol-phosphate aminotransferase
MKPKIPVRRSVARMRPYNPPLEGRGDKVRLDFNENPLGCSSAVRRALRELSAAAVSMYPEQESARAKLASFFRVRREELLLTNGTDEALKLLVDAFVDPGSSVLIVEPTFAMYRFYSELAGARVRALQYDDELRFPMKDVLAALRKAPRLFFLANPDSPTGNLLSPRELLKILKAAQRTMVVVDEAYFEFCEMTVLPWIRRHSNLIVTRTFSKAAGLAGLRLGCIFAEREIAAQIRKAQSPYPVNVAALAAGLAAMRDRGFIARTLRETRLGRKALEQGLNRLGIPFFPSDGNFVLVDFGSRAKEIVSALAHGGVLLRNRSSDFGGKGYVRITLGTLAQTRHLLRRLEEIL